MSYPGTPSGTPFRGQPSQMAAHPAYAAQMQVQMQMQHQHQHQHQHHRQPHPIQAPPAPPAAPSQHHPQQQLPPQHFTPHHSIPAQPHPPHPSSFPSTPAQNRPIHPLPQHNRLQHLQHPQQHAPRSPASASPAAAASPLPARPSHPMPSASTPLTSAPPRHSRTHRAADAPPDARKRPRKIIGDGYEAPYLEHAPTNRLLLSLKSGLNTQIDWALSRLAANSLSKHHVLPFEKVSGLADALLAYPRRLCAAINAGPTEAWDGPDFEQPPGVDDVGIGAGSDGDHQAGATWFVGGRGIPHQPSLAQSSSVRRRLLLMPSSIHRRRARIGALITSTAAADDADTDDDDDEEELEAYRDFSFDPARIPAHAALMRRALEAALILRNMTMHSANARHLVSIRGVQSLIRDVLALPSMVLVRDADADGRPRAESEEWLELEGVTELRLHFLDILEGIAPRLHLSQRAQFSIAAPGLAGCKTASSSDADDDLQHLPHRREVPILPIPNLAGNLRAADEIFLQLLDMAHNSADRAFLLGSLRCLSAMSASERNESAFVEAELPGGRQSPGLLTRCIELLPLTQDPELIEAALDLLYQLVCIGNNGLRLAARMPPTPSPASVTKAATSAAVASLPPAAKALAAASASARSFARTFATVRLLVRNLTVGKTIWERDHRLSLNREWSFAVPGRSREAARKDREARLRRQNETAEDRAKQKRLTRKEKQALVALNEPERGVEWMKIVFSGNMEKEVTQMEFWTAYKDEFFALAQANLAAPLQPAADLIRAVSHVFPGAAAMVVPATAPGTQPRFVIRGIEVRERDLSEPFQCGWRSCPAKATRSAEAQREHAETHVRFSRDGECQWLSCDFAVAADDGDDARRQQLRAHVLTHLPDLATKAAASGEAKKAAAAAAATVVEAARQHSGEPAEFERKTLPNGSRYIKAKREASSDAAPLPLPDAGGAGLTAAVVAKGAATPASGTVDNPGVLTFEVARTPSHGPEDSPSPQGIAFVSLLVLRMLTRNAAAVLDKAGIRSADDDGVGGAGGAGGGEDLGQTLRGEGDDKFGLPLPSHFALDRSGHGGSGMGGTARLSLSAAAGGASNGGHAGAGAAVRSAAGAADDSVQGQGQGQGQGQDWAVDAAQRFMDAMLAVEEDLANEAGQNDILCRYLNETLVEVRKRGAAERYGFEDLLVLAGRDADAVQREQGANAGAMQGQDAVRPGAVPAVVAG